MPKPQNLFDKLVNFFRGRNSKVSRRGAVSQRGLSVESLEDRRLLAVSPSQFYLNASRLVITGSNAVDTVSISQNTDGSISASLVSEGESLVMNYASAQLSQVIFYGREGNDSFNNTTALGSRVLGEGGNDTLIGGAGIDDLDGGDGDDFISGGAGADTLRGGVGNDTINGGADNDVITGSDGNDVLQGGDGIDNIRGGLGNDTIAGDAGDDRLYGDEGNDTISGGLGNDTIDGGDQDDSLTGEAGKDTISGAAGNDVIDGGDDNDTLYGNDGEDRLQGGAGNDYLKAGNGNDTLYGSFGDDRLYGEAGTDMLYGDDGVDDLNGGDDNDRLYGGAGNDALKGELGDDIIFGDAGNDIVYGGDGKDQIRGGDGNDTLRGGEGSDFINGQLGDDKLFGEGGNDTLSGDEGADELSGGDGDDKLLGGDGNDTLKGEIGNDLLYGDAGDDALHGNDGADQLRGGDGNDVLRGGADNDLLNGQLGDDRLFGEDGLDTLGGEEGNDELNGGEGNDKLLGGAGNDTLTGENGDDLLMGDAGNDVLYGGAGNDSLRGAEGRDVLRGNAGNDMLYGQADDDRIYGDEGNDNIWGDAGADEIWGGDGNDVVSGGDGNDSMMGEAGSDRLHGDADNDVVDGGDGIDQVYGGAGNDYLKGGLGNDFLYGDAGNDRLYGNEDNDTLFGGDGLDALYGGSGQDTMQGQAGDDELWGEDGDDLVDGNDGNDTLWGGLGVDRLYGNAGNDMLRGGGGNDSLYGNEGDDRLYGEDNNDLMFGGAGDDLLQGDFGNDLLVGEDGNDTLEAGADADVLIGGDGVDSLNGAYGEDILIGGIVSYDQDILETLLAAWGGSSSYQSRIDLIQDPMFEAYLQSEESVFDDYVVDSVLGSSDLDWFFVPGVSSIYNPVHDDHGQQEHAGHHHGAHVIDHLPTVEGFDLLDSLDNLRDVADGEVVHTLIPHADDMSKRREHLSLFELVRYDQVTHYAMSSGNWSDPATWHDGVVPSTNARVLIPIGVEVTVDRVLTTEIATIRVDGTLSFATNVNTQLRVDTLIVTDVGSYEMGTAETPIAANVTAKLVITDNGAINRAWDPFGISRGLITHGSVSIHGAAKTSFYEASPVAAGVTSIQLASVPAGWKVGDKIVIPGTVDGVFQDEERTISSIVGNRVSFSGALQHNHLTIDASQVIHVANLTRNVVLESEGTATERRGHVMFMHNDNVDVSYAKFLRLGRTDKSEVVNDSVVDASWNLVPGTGTNPRARYAVHFHRAGTEASGDPPVVLGSVVEDNVGWGFVNHSSYVDFVGNVAYNVTGAAFATEVGDETGSFRGNFALNVKASGDNIEARLAEQDHGHTGDGFWFQGAGITVVDNVAASAEGHAFIFYTRVLQFGGQKGTFLTSNLPDPSIAGGAESIPTDHVPIFEFSNNTGYSSGTGLAVWYNLRNTTHEASSVLKDSLFWNNTVGVDVSYTERAILRDLTVVHDFNAIGSFGVNSNAVSKDITYDNLTVSGYHIGIEVAKRGFSVVNGGSFATRVGVSVRPAAEDQRTVAVQGNFRMLAIPSQVLGTYIQRDVIMSFEDSEFKAGWGIDHLFYDSKVFLNYGLYFNQQLYSPMQVASAIPFPLAKPHIPTEYVGKTTGQLSQLGLTIYGEIAPLNVLSVLNLGGLLGLNLL